jgi:hypothetical protein
VSRVYCDPPYEHTTRYKGTAPFDHAAFWQTMRDWARHDNIVLVSEYHAPPDFVVVTGCGITGSRARGVVSCSPGSIPANSGGLTYLPPTKAANCCSNARTAVSYSGWSVGAAS